ncbi:MAG: DUF4241 domain-containing protein [Anaeromyxobacter sp.]
MPYLPNLAKVARAFSSEEVVDEGKKIRFSVARLDPLVVTSGMIAASDPLVEPEATAFERWFPAGRHPVRLAVALLENGDERVAFAEVRFLDVPCFMDADAGRLLVARMEAEEDYFETIIAEMDRTTRMTWSWASIRPAEDREENVVCFSSGWGDGVYPSTWRPPAPGRRRGRPRRGPGGVSGDEGGPAAQAGSGTPHNSLQRERLRPGFARRAVPLVASPAAVDAIKCDNPTRQSENAPGGSNRCYQM